MNPCLAYQFPTNIDQVTKFTAILVIRVSFVKQLTYANLTFAPRHTASVLHRDYVENVRRSCGWHNNLFNLW